MVKTYPTINRQATRKGKLRISISKHFSSSAQQTKVEKSMKSKQKKKAKTPEKAKESVKSPNRN